MIERIEKLRQLLQPAGQDAGAIAKAGAGQPAFRAAQHLVRRIAGHDLRAHRGQERRIDAGAAADF